MMITMHVVCPVQPAMHQAPWHVTQLVVHAYNAYIATLHIPVINVTLTIHVHVLAQLFQGCIHAYELSCCKQLGALCVFIEIY